MSAASKAYQQVLTEALLGRHTQKSCITQRRTCQYLCFCTSTSALLVQKQSTETCVRAWRTQRGTSVSSEGNCSYHPSSFPVPAHPSVGTGKSLKACQQLVKHSVWLCRSLLGRIAFWRGRIRSASRRSQWRGACWLSKVAQRVECYIATAMFLRKHRGLGSCAQLTRRPSTQRLWDPLRHCGWDFHLCATY